MAKLAGHRRVVGAIAAAVTLAAVLGGQAAADPAQDDLADFTELSRQVEELSQTIVNAQPDLDNKLKLLSEADAKHSADLANLEATKQQLAGYQSAVDQFATAVYMGGRTDSMSAILTASSPADLIDRLASQRVIGSQMTDQMNGLRQANTDAQAAATASQESATQAKDAVDAAVAVRSDLQNKRAELRQKMVAVNASYARIPPEQQAALTLPTAAVTEALGPIAPIPTVGFSGLVPNARMLADYIMATYPGVQSIGGVRADPLPDHPSGRAIDIMIGSDMGLGDAINADVQAQAARFGVSYTMWRVAAHFDHVHVTVN
ncbi:hypothetical protein [Mycolicibacterium brumae]|uniref:ARB-07466-like C-terminal domain-containing protein n=1 Tax=Mycolicibacterium brumae TaxID=85968 RepID=A0A2G5PGI4_9MYCO|nr:hypothetical protein [Mycolicibacterium brumae]MCV7194339.1 hypothetical protein [Mycolicibacterium brumae]PIB77260.1 hypothetical protein CQY22_003205 [Mycolicibacterium brumae]RWA15513.1 hypothetical protein MBRU_10710 [Mycolicibacterium brumae DSM 44177]UWW10624.1 hypothetical protein L2Z93_003758 [Mycolicibacterium brumae]